MINGEIKSKVDGMWNDLAAGGITNPLEVIEQVTYLMFIRNLSSIDNRRREEAEMLDEEYDSIFDGVLKINGREIEGEQLKWSTFKDFSPERQFEIVSEFVFPFIKTMHADKDSAFSKYMDDATFKLPTPNILAKTIASLDVIYDLMDKMEKEGQTKIDVTGDLYEYLLEKLSTAGRNGQFRTPRHIIKMMVEMMDPKPDDTVIDPACGTAGFVYTAAQYVRETYKSEVMYNAKKKEHFMNDMFFGYEMDRTMLRIAAMNMMMHGIENPTIEYKDSLSDQNMDSNKYSIILANPPFKGSLDYEIVNQDLLKVCKTKKTELLFVTLFLRMLKTGGKCACIVPDGVLFGSSNAHKAIRKEIIENNQLQAVISMPSGVFKPYAGVSTAILFFTKTGQGGTDKVWFYDMQADGYTLDDKRSVTEQNDIPDILSRWKNLGQEADRKRTDKSFLVSVQEIIDNNYDLSINKYKEVEYVPVEYEPTEVILSKIESLEEEIQKEFSELKKLLSD